MASADATEVVDAGLQAERTQLSWSRTALSVAAVGALLLQRGVETGHALGEVGGALGLTTAVATYLTGTIRYRTTSRNVREHRSIVSVAAIRVLAGLSAILACIALVLITL